MENTKFADALIKCRYPLFPYDHIKSEAIN